MNSTRTEVQITTANITDTADIMAINQECLSEPFTEDWYQSHFDSADDFVKVARYRNAITGFIICKIRPEGGYISYLAVQRDKRKLGIGRLLVQAAAQDFRLLGKTHLRLHVQSADDAARGFYARVGFEEVLTVNNYYGKGEPGILLRSEL